MFFIILLKGILIVNAQPLQYNYDFPLNTQRWVMGDFYSLYQNTFPHRALDPFINPFYTLSFINKYNFERYRYSNGIFLNPLLFSNPSTNMLISPINNIYNNIPVCMFPDFRYSFNYYSNPINQIIHPNSINLDYFLNYNNSLSTIYVPYFPRVSVFPDPPPKAPYASIIPPNTLPFAPGEILVKFRSGVNLFEINRIHSKYGAYELYTSPYGGFKRVAIPPTSFVPEMCEIYNKEPGILYAEPNYLGRWAYIPNDVGYNPYQKWYWNNINAELAWDFSTGIGVTVAILDSGVAYEDYYDPITGTLIYQRAPDLAGTLFVDGFDFVNFDTQPNDDLGHGTFVCGVVAQTTNNFIGGAGLAHHSNIMPIKVGDKDTLLLSTIADAVYWATIHGAKVINMSFSIPNSLSLHEAIDTAYWANVVCVASAGNESSQLPRYPAAYDTCIAVSATKLDNSLTSYSNFGTWIDFCAPGGQIYVNPITEEINDQNYDTIPDAIYQQSFTSFFYPLIAPNDFKIIFGPSQGTSFSAPIVSGIVALMFEKNILLTPEQVYLTLQTTAIDLYPPGKDVQFGHGLVNAYQAVSNTY